MIGEAIEHRAGLVLIPVERLEDEFFRLRTRVAGEIVQKFVNYGLRLAIGMRSGGTLRVKGQFRVAVIKQTLHAECTQSRWTGQED